MSRTPEIILGLFLFKGTTMQWSADNLPASIKNKPLKYQELFIKTANAALAKGFSKDESMFAGANAVKIEENKNKPAKEAKAKPAVTPSHVPSTRSFTDPFEVVSKAAEQVIFTPSITAVEINQAGYIVITLSDGKKITSKNKAIQENVSQNITITQDNQALSAMSEPTGFSTRSTSSISFDDATRTFTISAVNPQQGFSVWLHAKENTYNSESIQITDTTGVHFIYFDYPSCALSTTTIITPDLFLTTALVALVYWRADQQKHIYFADERHGIVMDGATHQHFHLSIGAQYRSGLALNNFLVDQDASLASHSQFGCQDGVIADEDLTINIIDNAPQDISSIAKLPVFYRIGSNTNWYRKTATNFALILPTEVQHYTGTTRPAYNYYNGSNWVLNEVPNNEFILVHVLATNDVETPIVAILGHTYQTKTAARTGAKTELKDMTGLPFLEFVKLGSIIFQSANSYSNSPKARIVSTDTAENYVDYRTSIANLVLF